MAKKSPNSSGAALRILAVSLVVATILVFWSSVVNLDHTQGPFYDLPPDPDASEYLDGAVALFREGSHHIHIGSSEHPSRYPPGFSLLLTPFLPYSDAIVETPFLANQVYAALLLLVALVGGWCWKGLFTGALTAFLLSTQPSFITLSRSPMSEIAGGLFLILGLLFLARWLGEPRATWIALGALLVGVSCSIRMAHLVIGCLLLLTLTWVTSSWGQRIRTALWFGSFFLLGLLPVMLHNLSWFGSPLASGYDYWLGDPELFSLTNLPRKASLFWGELTLQKTPFNTAGFSGFYGDGRFFGPATALLTLLLAFFYRKDRRFWILALPCLGYAVLMCFYDFGDGRLLWPVILAGVVFVGIAAGLFVRNSDRKLSWRISVVILLILVALDLPNRQGGSGLMANLRPEFNGTAAAYRMWQSLEGMVRLDSMVFSDLIPPYLQALSPRPIAVYPFQDRHSYSFNPQVFRVERRARAQLAAESLAQGREVFLLARRVSLDTAQRYLPLPAGFGWKIEQQTSRGMGVARAVAVFDSAPEPSAAVRVNPFRSDPLRSPETLPLILDGVEGSLQVNTRLLIFAGGPGGRIWLETISSSDARMTLQDVWGRTGTRFDIELAEGEILALTSTGSGGLRSGAIRFERSPGIAVTAILTLLDLPSRSVVTETSLALGSPEANSRGTPLSDWVLREKLRDLPAKILSSLEDLSPDNPSQVTGSFILPAINDGVGEDYRYQTELTLAGSRDQSILQLQFFDSEGKPETIRLGDLGSATEFSIPLRGGEIVRLETSGTGVLKTGYMRGKATGELRLQIRLQGRDPESGELLWEVPIPLLQNPGSQFSLPVDTTGLRETYLSLLNPTPSSSSEAARITLHYSAENSGRLETHEIQLDPGHQFQTPVQILFESSEERLGLVTVKSNVPLIALALEYLETYDAKRARMLPKIYPLPLQFIPEQR